MAHERSAAAPGVVRRKPRAFAAVACICLGALLTVAGLVTGSAPVIGVGVLLVIVGWAVSAQREIRRGRRRAEGRDEL